MSTQTKPQTKQKKQLFTETTSKTFIWLGLVIFIVGLVLFFSRDTIVLFGQVIEFEKVGQFGDFIGGIIGSLWALAGVILFYVALNKHEIEMKRNMDVFSKQQSTLSLQQFETSYFNLVNLHHQIVGDIDLFIDKKGGISNIHKKGHRRVVGRDCFLYFYEELKLQYENFTAVVDEQKRIQMAYSAFFELHKTDLSHYFMHTYNILKFINKNNQGNPFLYANVFRGQLSPFETVLLFYHGLSDVAPKQFKGLLEQSHTLLYLSKEFIYQEAHLDRYHARAYAPETE